MHLILCLPLLSLRIGLSIIGPATSVACSSWQLKSHAWPFLYCSRKLPGTSSGWNRTMSRWQPWRCNQSSAYCFACFLGKASIALKWKSSYHFWACPAGIPRSVDWFAPESYKFAPISWRHGEFSPYSPAKTWLFVLCFTVPHVFHDVEINIKGKGNKKRMRQGTHLTSNTARADREKRRSGEGRKFVNMTEQKFGYFYGLHISFAQMK